eukprot:EG_transcript_53181
MPPPRGRGGRFQRGRGAKGPGLRRSQGRLKKRQSKDKVREKHNALIDRMQGRLQSAHELEEAKAAALLEEQIEAPQETPYDRLCQLLGVGADGDLQARLRRMAGGPGAGDDDED